MAYLQHDTEAPYIPKEVGKGCERLLVPPEKVCSTESAVSVIHNKSAKVTASTQESEEYNASMTIS